MSAPDETTTSGASAGEDPSAAPPSTGAATGGGSAAAPPSSHPGIDRHRYQGPPTWLPLPAVVIVIAAIQLVLPQSVTLGPIWLIPVLELIGVPIAIALWALTRSEESTLTDRFLDGLMTVYLFFLVAASALNASLLLLTLLRGSTDTANELLFAGFAVLIINVLTFGLFYWWLDGGGPRVRAMGEVKRWDFQYPQQAAGDKEWLPGLFDYFYTAYTNVIAFSPTDTMPLTHRVKFLFTVESAISLVTILVTVSRAINMLPGVS